MKAFVAAALLASAAAAGAATEEVITIPTRPGVTVSYLLVRDPSATPKIVVVSFVGGFGAIGLGKRAAAGPVKFGPGTNFLIRVRGSFADADFADAIVDAPSDQLPDGMRDEFRLGPEHSADIRAVIADLRKRFPLVSATGGDPPQSGPCDPQAPHGYFGLDAAVTGAIRAWMQGRDFPREIP